MAVGEDHTIVVIWLMEHFLYSSSVNWPIVNFSIQEASISLLFLSIRGQTEWKPQSQKTKQTDYMDHSFVQCNETMSYAV